MAFLLSSSATLRPFLLSPSPPKPPPHLPPLLLLPKASLQELQPHLQHQQDEQEPPQPPPASTKPRSKWVNPNNPTPSRHTHLTALALSLSSASPPPVHTIPSALSPGDSVTLLSLLTDPRSVSPTLLHLLPSSPSPLLLLNVSLNTLRRLRALPEAEALFSDLVPGRVSPDNHTFSTLISCALAARAPARAVEWFRRLPEFGLVPDQFTLSAAIRALGLAGEPGEALALYDRARSDRLLRVDPVMFSTVIRIHSLAGNFDGALSVFEEMKALGARPNVVVFNTLLDAMGRARRPWQVKSLFDDMIARGIAPTGATYAALLRAYAKCRYPDDALSVYREMRSKGFPPSIVLYNTVLSMCADLGLVDAALEVFEAMKAEGDRCRPDSWTFSSLITIFSCSGRVAEAEGVLELMREAGIEPNLYVFTSLIQCYGKAGRTDNVVRAFDRVIGSGIVPDDRFCGCLLNVMTQTPKEEIRKVTGCIEIANVKLGSLVKQLIDRNGDVDEFRREAEELFGEISEVVKKAYCNCLIDICINQDLLERACVLLELGMKLGIYGSLQSKSETQWSLHAKGLSLGAALTALHVWMNDLMRAMEGGEELPPLLGIHTGHGRHKYAGRGLAGVFQSHLKELNAPFHESTDKAGWFLTTKIAAEPWLRSRSNLVAS